MTLEEAIEESAALVEDAKPVPCEVVAVLLKAIGIDVEVG